MRPLLRQLMQALGLKIGAKMDIEKLKSILIKLGGAILAVAVVWWFVFYSEVVNELGRGKGWDEAFVCLYSSSGECAFISGLAKFGGATPYEPIVFWVGVIILGIGLLLKFTQKKENT